MRADAVVFALICTSLALGCGSEKNRGAPDGGSGTPGTGGSSGSTGSAGSSGASAGSTGSSGASGGSGASDGAGGSSDGSGGTGGSQGADDGGTADSGIDAGPVDCLASPQVFPVFDRVCWDDFWCAVAIHQTDCCGNRQAVGVLHPELERFDPAERICKSQYPACGCPAGPVTTDTGQTATDVSTIKVQCRNNVCTSYVP
jgi:hypothetical protein